MAEETARLFFLTAGRAQAHDFVAQLGARHAFRPLHAELPSALDELRARQDLECCGVRHRLRPSAAACHAPHASSGESLRAVKALNATQAECWDPTASSARAQQARSNARPETAGRSKKVIALGSGRAERCDFAAYCTAMPRVLGPRLVKAENAPTSPTVA